MGWMLKAVCGAAMAALAGCVAPGGPALPPLVAGFPDAGPIGSDQAARNFVAVVRRVEPVAEQECTARNPRANCDFQILIDDREGQPPNAFQTLDARGRPLVVFTLALIADARNEDELAFVLGHEASHHIAGHIPRVQQSAQVGAIILGTLASLNGATAASVQSAQQMGATLGARTFSRDFELEADALGTVIAFYAGYDPERGAAFFSRLPDPGDRFLGSHPPNAERVEVVRRTLAELRGY